LGSAEVTFFPGDLQLEADPFHEFFLAEGLPGGHWPWPWAESKKDTKKETMVEFAERQLEDI